MCQESWTCLTGLQDCACGVQHLPRLPGELWRAVNSDLQARAWHLAPSPAGPDTRRPCSTLGMVTDRLHPCADP